MTPKEKGIFIIVTNSGKEVKVQVIKQYGERHYSVLGSPFAYNTKKEIKECKFIEKEL